MADQRPVGSEERPAIATGSRVIIVVSRGPAPHAARSYVTVPDVIGAEQGSALTKLQEAGFEARVFSDYSSTVKRGRVMGQLPATGLTVPAGATGVVLSSSGPAAGDAPLVPLPDVVGLTEAEAVDTLANAQLSPQVVHDHSPSVAEGIVMAQLPDPSLQQAPPRRPIWPWVLAAAVAVILLALLAYLFLGQAEVPDVLGQTQTTAEQNIEQAGLEVGEITTTTEIEDAEPGTVVEQSPEGGQQVRRGSTVNLVIAAEDEDVAVPNVIRMTEAEAVAALRDVDLLVEVTNAPSQMVDAGLVISQTPGAGQTVPRGTTVGIVVSEGERVENVQVPNVTGLTRQDAEQALTEAGLRVAVAESPSAEFPSGVVISQLPASGESVAPGTTIGIQVSTGPPESDEQVGVPDVVGDSLAAGQNALSDAGLQSTTVAVAGTGRPANEIVAQTPSGGQQVAPDTTVVLFYSAGE